MPDAADVRAGLEHHHLLAHAPQGMKRAQAGKARADNDHIHTVQDMPPGLQRVVAAKFI